MERQTIDSEIKKTEEEIKKKHDFIANSLFQPPETDFNELNRLYGKMNDLMYRKQRGDMWYIEGKD